ncbi:MAG TPA: hypothetical protein VGR06_21100 [Actinophytocola sp.]|uniref:hypothetical protein n=1 Tax=Actinophytocola sp. TaxID=1872138 RepID=UPI002E05430F|nr:hypothetical protein [Actinophytocola sp.]
MVVVEPVVVGVGLEAAVSVVLVGSGVVSVGDVVVTWMGALTGCGVWGCSSRPPASAATVAKTVETTMPETASVA